MSGSERSKQSRKAQEVGRGKILEAARALFRENVKHEVSRLDIARQAGVAPALLTYYFEDNVELVLAATRPVVSAAISDLVQALDASASCEERFRQCIKLFLDFAEKNAPILDIYVETAIKSGDDQAQVLIASTLDRLSIFFKEAVLVGLIAKNTNPQFLLLALWGMCRLIGGTRPYPLPIVGSDGQSSDTRQIQVELILQFVLKGAGNSRRSRPRARNKPLVESLQGRQP